ncbi:MAG: hypothetical protein CYG60_23990 [Actinobacteria bacterium]|nr:MAG: hypothetical protein CYG60_23990 [Actinomycetota bacterium]
MGESPGEKPELEPGLGRWIRRNPWLLMRLFMVLVFSFGASTTAVNFSYGLEINPVQLTAEELNEGRLPPGTQLQDFVEITGTPNYGEDTSRIGTEESGIGFVERYSVGYFYFGLEETGDNLLIQTVNTPPDVTEDGEQVWRGQLSNVATAIFQDTTQRGLTTAGLPSQGEIPIIETGETPDYHRQIFPAYSAIIGLWVFAMAWLVWKKNKPIAGA